MTQKKEYRERTIDFLKGLCILLVCFTHYNWESTERRALLFPWWVDMAVPVFMVLSGYVYEKSLGRKHIVTLSQAYAAPVIVNKMIRFTVPVLIVYIATLTWDINRYADIPYDIFITFLQGGRGQGSYYYPVMMQTIFVLPVIGMLIKRQEEKGLLICLITNMVYEILHVAYNIPVESYRLLMFRYIFVLAAGCYAALDKPIPHAIPIAMFGCGTLFLYGYLYMGYKPAYVIHWTGTSFIAAMFIIPFVWFLIRKCTLRFTPLEFLGKASYHIFVMQMLYYYSVASIVYQAVESRKGQLLISMGVCICSGILLYFIELPLSKYIRRKTEKLLVK